MSSILSSPELSFVAVVLFTNSSNSISTAESEKKKNVKRDASWRVVKRKGGKKTGWQRVGHTVRGRIYMLSTKRLLWRRAWRPTPVSCLEKLTDRKAWQATVHFVMKSWTRLKRLSMHTCAYSRDM